MRRTAPANLAGLRDTLILINEYDTLRGEAKPGVVVTVTRFDGLVHGMYWMYAGVPRSEEHHKSIVAFLREQLG